MEGLQKALEVLLKIFPTSTFLRKNSILKLKLSARKIILSPPHFGKQLRIIIPILYVFQFVVELFWELLKKVCSFPLPFCLSSLVSPKSSIPPMGIDYRQCPVCAIWVSITNYVFQLLLVEEVVCETMKANWRNYGPIKVCSVKPLSNMRCKL